MSALYLEGQLIGKPAVTNTSKGSTVAKFVLEVETTRIVRQSPVTESTLLPIISFSWIADAIAELSSGMRIVVGARLSGTEFRLPSGEVRRGVQLVAESVAILAVRRKAAELNA